MRDPLLSVCLPTYNRGNVLASGISAFLRMADSEEIEIVVSDNASTDGTVEALSEIADPRLTVVRSDANVGAFENQLRAFSAARGRWLMQLTDKDGLRAEALTAALAALRGTDAVCGGFRLDASPKKDDGTVTCWKGGRAYARIGLAYAHPSGRFFRSDVLRRPGLLDRLRALDVRTRPYSTDYLTSLCLAVGGAYADVDIPFVRHNLPPYEGVVRSFSYDSRRTYYFTPDFVFEEFLLYVRFLETELRLPALSRLAAVFGTVRRALLPRMTVIYRAILENDAICAWYGVDEAFRRCESAKDLVGDFLSRTGQVRNLTALDAIAVRLAIAGCGRRVRRASKGGRG